MPITGPILIICPEEESQGRVVASVEKCGLPSLACSSYREARSLLARQNFGAVMCSDRLEDGDFRDVIKAARPVPVVVLSRLAEWSPYLSALRAGAFDYIACPPNRGEVERILWQALNEASQFHREVVTAE